MRKLVLLLIAFVAVPALHGQYADVSAGGGAATISAPWRFHTGDDPQWAMPSFDDSHWPLLRMDKPWAQQGYKGYYGFSWYRIKLKLPSTETPLALGFTELNSADEIYADGQFIGSIGKMRPTPVWLGYTPDVHCIPLPAALHGRTIELAIRVWQPQASANDVAFIGRTANPRVGAVETITNLHKVSLFGLWMAQVPSWIVDIIAIGIGLFSLGLFFLRRRATEYAWAGLFLLDSAAPDIGSWFYHTRAWPAFDWIFVATCLSAAMLIFWLLFIWRFLRAPADRLLRTGIALLLLVPIPALLARWGLVTITDANLSWVIVPLVLVILVIARLVRLAWRGNREAQLLLIPFLLSNLMQAITETMDFLYWVGAIRARRGGNYLLLYHGPNFSLSWEWLFGLLSDLTVAALLMLRFARAAERDERLSAEMEAAHRVQAQLVPAQLPATPHFRFEAAYRAASEVGGDLYQVFPQPDGSVVAAIGDVSGKGLKAAMLGTLVVGALRSLAQEGLRPAQILTRLNQQLTASTDGGFVTGCIAHVSVDGRLTLANAGHLPPYRNGKELEGESGFPLGMIADAFYGETCSALEPGDRLTFLSDGVVEARNAVGELFGFERAARLSTGSAAELAKAAEAFGQEDDITVLTLTWLAADEEPGGDLSREFAAGWNPVKT